MKASSIILLYFDDGIPFPISAELQEIPSIILARFQNSAQFREIRGTEIQRKRLKLRNGTEILRN